MINNIEDSGYRSDGLRAWKGWNVVLPLGENDAVALGTYFYYDGGFPVLETSSSGTVTAINVFAPDGLVARKVSGAWRHYQFDAQGSVMHRLRDDETVINNSKYDAYGMHVSMPFPVADAFGYNGRWGYYSDDETGLILCMHRYYDAASGRWLTRDPIGYAGGINSYAYCGGSPVGAMDPSGLILETIADIVGIGVDIVEFVRDPSLENGLMLGWSIGATIAPGVPGSWTKRIADAAGNLSDVVRVGRRGNPDHVAAVIACEADVKAMFPQLIHVAGGSLKERLHRDAGRAPDLWFRDSATGANVFYQIGRTNSKGLPVRREWNAGNDLSEFGDVNFVPLPPKYRP